MKLELPTNPRYRIYFLLFAVLVVFGGITAGRMIGYLFLGVPEEESAGGGGGSMVVAALPGPPRDYSVEFRLDAEKVQRMTGMNDFRNERWSDIAGNYYTREFVDTFDYENPTEDGPRVLLRIDPAGSTLTGRLEAHGLKPNFAYQIKLRGLYEVDPVGFEHIGYTGRWRLPGIGTNYTDTDYQLYEPKADVEAYILFDFFVTDAAGNAARDIALDSSLHVLWNATRQGGGVNARNVWPAVIAAQDPEHYSRPKNSVSVELLWAEREAARYGSGGAGIRLPPHSYKAELVLTEESFHSKDNDGGYWATVYRCPVEFEIVGDTADQDAAE